jgi:hypothetical protein
VFRLMGRLIGLALAENIPLGVPLASGFFKLLAADGIFPEDVNLDDLMEIDQALHRTLATTLPSMPDCEMRQALECMTFSVPSRTQQVFLLGYNLYFLRSLHLEHLLLLYHSCHAIQNLKTIAHI